MVNGYKWELYNLAEDFSQNNDLAAKMPDKLRQMQELFLVDSEKFNVFPLDNSILERLYDSAPDCRKEKAMFKRFYLFALVPAMR